MSLSSSLHDVAESGTFCRLDVGVEFGSAIGHGAHVGDVALINRVSARQHGVFSLSQARTAGFGRSAMKRRVDNGQWLLLDHSVLAMPSAPATWERQLSAALVSRPRSVVGGRSAADLLGLDGFTKGRPVIIVPAGSNLRSDLARMIESDQFDSLSTTVVAGFSATTTPETLLSLAADLDPSDLERAFDQALLSGRLDLDSMKAILDREVGRRPRGIRLLRELTHTRLPTAPTKDASYLEALLQRVLHGAAIPPWGREYAFSLGSRPARVDVFVPDWALVIEADGRNWHLRRRDFEADRRRDNELASRGIQVLRYTYRMLSEEADRCVAEILAVGAVRAAQRVVLALPAVST